MRYIFCLFLVGSVCTVNAQTAFNIQKGGHAYNIEVPEYMDRVYDLNSVASLQYMNTSKPAYVIVIEDSKAELKYYDIFFAGARDFLTEFLDTYNLDVENRELSPIIDFTVGGVRYSQVKMTWSEEVSDLFMLITVVETATHFYKILSWTHRDMMDELIDDFIRIAASLRE